MWLFICVAFTLGMMIIRYFFLQGEFMYTATIVNLLAGVLNLILYCRKPNIISLVCAIISLSAAFIFLPA